MEVVVTFSQPRDKQLARIVEVAGLTGVRNSGTVVPGLHGVPLAEMAGQRQGGPTVTELDDIPTAEEVAQPLKSVGEDAGEVTPASEDSLRGVPEARLLGTDPVSSCGYSGVVEAARGEAEPERGSGGMKARRFPRGIYRRGDVLWIRFKSADGKLSGESTGQRDVKVAESILAKRRSRRPVRQCRTSPPAESWA